jgi:hypothetical protein
VSRETRDKRRVGVTLCLGRPRLLVGCRKAHKRLLRSHCQMKYITNVTRVTISHDFITVSLVNWAQLINRVVSDSRLRAYQGVRTNLKSARPAYDDGDRPLWRKSTSAAPLNARIRRCMRARHYRLSRINCARVAKRILGVGAGIYIYLLACWWPVDFVQCTSYSGGWIDTRVELLFAPVRTLLTLTDICLSHKKFYFFGCSSHNTF